MIKVGITGGIGSGKSTVCKVFEMLGVPVYYADDRAKNILDSNPEVLRKVVAVFGSEILNEEKRVDKKKLAALVFNNTEKLEILNKIIHPAVAMDFIKWCEERKHHPYILKEAAILFESGAHKSLDQVIAIAAPVEVRIKRVTNRDKVSEEEVRSRMSRQMSEEERISRSAFVIANDEEQLVIPQILDLHRRFAADN